MKLYYKLCLKSEISIVKRFSQRFQELEAKGKTPLLKKSKIQL
jgi:hypothetical protein